MDYGAAYCKISHFILSKISNTLPEPIWMGTMSNSWFGFYNETGTYMDTVTRCHNTLRAEHVAYETSLEVPWIMNELYHVLLNYDGWDGKVSWQF